MKTVFVCKVATDDDIAKFEGNPNDALCYSKLREDYRYYVAMSAKEASMYFIEDIMMGITKIDSKEFVKNVLVMPANFDFDDKPELFTVKITYSVEKYKK